jgi:oligo-1,6-glucosidase
MASIHHKGRDNARTPMQWDRGDQAGFTTGTPWIQVNKNYTSINVEQQLRDPGSILNYYKKLIQLRKQYEVIVYGDYQMILDDHSEIYAYVRRLGNENLLVILNFFSGTPIFQLPYDLHVGATELLISNYSVENDGEVQEIKLQPYEARVYRFLS